MTVVEHWLEQDACLITVHYNTVRTFLFNDTLNTLHLQLCGIGHMVVKDHSNQSLLYQSWSIG